MRHLPSRTATFAISLWLAILWSGCAVIAGPLDEPHLNILPRTAAESARVAAMTRPARSFDAPQPGEALPAGAATVSVAADRDAFSRPLANLDFEEILEFHAGNRLFRRIWISDVSTKDGDGGLGPLYNARSCQRCHIRDGRGHPPDGPDEDAISMVMQLSVPESPFTGTDVPEPYRAPRPDPVYGIQLQDFAVPGLRPEYRLRVTHEEIEVRLSGDEVAQLRRPLYRIADPGYGPLHPDAMFSPRVAPQMIGLGLIEAIPAADILALADPEDADGDGISGRANVVWSVEYDRPMLGRFGHKAGVATLAQQSAMAFAADIGISNPLFPAHWGDCTMVQHQCRDAPAPQVDAATTEIDRAGLDLVTAYSRSIAVPARHGTGDPAVLHGKRVFFETGCAACHRPAFVTHRLADRAAHGFQLIWPFSDLLLHDMGPDLADGRPEAGASGREWRTAPLWGIGRTQAVSGHTRFLHDGRARSLLEAILWHGGEARPQRDLVITMPPGDRAALIRFLESL